MRIRLMEAFVGAFLLKIGMCDDVEKCFTPCREKNSGQALISCAVNCVGISNATSEDIKSITECTKKCDGKINCHILCIREYFKRVPENSDRVNVSKITPNFNPTTIINNQVKTIKQDVKISTEVTKSSITSHSTLSASIAIAMSLSASTTPTVRSAPLPFSPGFPSNKTTVTLPNPNRTGAPRGSEGNFITIPLLLTSLISWASYLIT
ncbi:hypothetical protein K7432_000935 [Basidiobolus ranarum]|uniref:Uncharacterized protein n=1 Tax=Basidiobolus ranarum TaxID=34480 RepID=A0ABR2WAE7_9FUNG